MDAKGVVFGPWPAAGHRAWPLGPLLVAVFLLRLVHIDQPIVENYVGRQIPTAMVARNLERGSGLLHPRLDTGPFPNYFLVEPPVYEWAVVALRCETDFTAKSAPFTAAAQAIADAVVTGGEGAADSQKDTVDDLKVTTKENVEIGDVIRAEAADGDVIDTYLHRQDGRGVNAVIVELAGGDKELAHDIAVHIAFAKPRYLAKEDVPADVVDEERATLETITRNEGKPEQAIQKIVDGRIQGFFKEIALLEQPYAKDDKQSVKDVLGGAQIVRYEQVVIG